MRRRESLHTNLPLRHVSTLAISRLTCPYAEGFGGVTAGVKSLAAEPAAIEHFASERGSVLPIDLLMPPALACAVIRGNKEPEIRADCAGPD